MKSAHVKIMIIAGLLIQATVTAAQAPPAPTATCIAGPLHPAECTTGTSDAPFSMHVLRPLVFEGFIVSEVRWGAEPGEALYRSCEIRNLGIVPWEQYCLDQGSPPPAGSTWTHRCYTILGSVGTATCAVVSLE